MHQFSFGERKTEDGRPFLAHGGSINDTRENRQRLFAAEFLEKRCTQRLDSRRRRPVIDRARVLAEFLFESSVASSRARAPCQARIEGVRRRVFLYNGQ